MATKRSEDPNRRDQLLRASARLFREKGYDATSVRDIAAATGMQSGSWVYHFRTKQDILAAVMEEGLARALARIEAIARLELEPREKFRALVHTHLENLLGPGQDYIPVLLYERRSLEKAQQARVIAPQKRYEQAWSDVIAELQACGEWQLPGRIDRLLMFGALNWIVIWYRGRGDLTVDELTEECVRFFLRTPEPRRPGRAPARRKVRTKPAR
jgi:TetR/AcrR family transcriptional regulator, cholesterol catabolism regulator